jgi:hypothetical protein
LYTKPNHYTNHPDNKEKNHDTVLGKNIDQHYITDLVKKNLGYPTSASLGAKAKKTQERLEGAIILKKKTKKKINTIK